MRHWAPVIPGNVVYGHLLKTACALPRCFGREGGVVLKSASAPPPHSLCSYSGSRSFFWEDCSLSFCLLSNVCVVDILATSWPGPTSLFHLMSTRPLLCWLSRWCIGLLCAGGGTDGLPSGTALQPPSPFPALDWKDAAAAGLAVPLHFPQLCSCHRLGLMC